jgi:chromosome segregation ATPase
MDDEIVLPVEHFEDVGQSLPELTTELLSAHTTQSSEMQGREDLLLKLKAEMVHLQKQLHTLDRDVSSTVRSICLKEGLLAELCQDCEQLELQLVAVVQEKVALESKLIKMSEERATKEKMRNIYESRMEAHCVKTQEVQQLSDTQIELEALRKKIHNLKEKS